MSRLVWWREALLVVAMYAVYSLARSLQRGGVLEADRHGWAILTLERACHLSPEGWLNAHLSALPVVAVPACYLYATLHFVVTPSVLVWAYRTEAGLYLRARSTLAMTTFGALVDFWRYPTAPPRLLGAAGFQDTLGHFSSWGWWGSETSLPTGAASLANEFAAMPSLHVAWSIWCATTMLALTRRRSARILALAYPVVTTVVVMVTANHYLLDAMAGALLWAGADVLVRTVGSRPAAELVPAALD
jgi:hypothetical protein